MTTFEVLTVVLGSLTVFIAASALFISVFKLGIQIKK